MREISPRIDLRYKIKQGLKRGFSNPSHSNDPKPNQGRRATPRLKEKIRLALLFKELLVSSAVKCMKGNVLPVWAFAMELSNT